MRIPLLSVLSMMLLAGIGQSIAADDMSIEDFARDIIPVEVQLHVNYLGEGWQLVGDPPVRARNSTRINFVRRGVYTLIRFREGVGIDFMAVPGTQSIQEWPQTTGLSVYQTHTCVDDQTMPIGRESRDLSASAEIHNASGGINLYSVEGQPDRVRFGLHSFKVSTDYVDCPNNRCFIHNFSFNGSIAEDRDQWVETEAGHKQYLGIEMAVVDWDLVKSLAEGGELPLVIPVSITHTEETAGQYEGDAMTVTISGAIAPLDELPLEPLVPETEEDEG